jgi:diguanylate cyclase (GGDEF)-like protein/PAS domain S-box-containing protein
MKKGARNMEHDVCKRIIQNSPIGDYLPEAAMAIDKESRVILWNKAIEKMTGIPAGEMIGKGNYAYAVPFFGDAQPQPMDLYFLDDEAILSHYPTITREEDVVMAEVFCPALHNNQGTWVVMKASPLRDPAGNIIGAIESIRDIADQKLAEAAMASRTLFFDAQLNAALDGVMVSDENQKIMLINRSFYEILNVPQYLIDGKDDSLLLKYVIGFSKNPEALIKTIEHLTRHPDETSREDDEFQNGTILERFSAPVIDKAGHHYGRIWTIHDITARKKLEAALSEERTLLRTTLISIGDGVISTDNMGRIVFINRMAEFLTGWTQVEAVGKPCEEVFNIINKHTKAKREDIVQKVLQSGEAQELVRHTLLISKDGIERPVEDSAAPIINENGDTIGVVLVFRDFSEKQQRLEKIEYLSYHDQLTGLYNRRYYQEELKRLDTKRNLPISIIMGDVNGLKLVNDSFGHEKGDELLRKAADAIKKGCRADEIVARLGGDEFVVLLPKTDAVQAEQFVKRINELLKKEKVVNLDVSVSFGCKAKISEHEKMQDIFKAAEDQMYENKNLNHSRNNRNMIDLILNALFEKNHREMLHSKRVGEICEAIALNMNFNKETVYTVKIAGLMHDIGKIGIEDEMLNKPGKLSPDEWVAMKKHPEIGQRILSAVKDFSEIGDYIFEHQEKWDGTGYPQGLKGDEILLQARIIAVADSYDAMTTQRNYREAFSEEEAIQEIKRCSGTQFDPTIARIFVEKVLGKQWE